MDMAKIRTMPVVVENVHESVYRAYHILVLVKALLELNTDPSVIAMIINSCEDCQPHSPNDGIKT
ncbi:hypothetical protein KAR91_40360 [Candidatus Pacearchaeota archaeon]|nr:hypothetical protein [Candidatus Pacearchaeota archaeon]